MAHKSMRCASKASAQAVAWMRSAVERATHDLAAVVYSPDDANEQPATLNVSGVRKCSQVAYFPAASAVCDRPIDVDP